MRIIDPSDHSIQVSGNNRTMNNQTSASADYEVHTMKQLQTKLIVLLSLAGLYHNALAIGPILELEQAAEADRVVVRIDPNGQGSVTLTGCSICPHTIKVTEETQYHYLDKMVPHSDIAKHNGKPAAISFNNSRASRVIWY
jgi:hypothetical protein